MMIPHVSMEDAKRWAPGLKSDAEFVASALASGRTERGRLHLFAFSLHVKEAAYHRVLNDTIGVRQAFLRALDRFSMLAAAADTDPEWVRQALEKAAQIALVVKDDARVEQALDCAERLMRIDEDDRDFFVAAEAYLYRGDRTAAAECVRLASRRKGRYSFGLLDALRGVVAGNAEQFVRGLTAATKVFDADSASSGRGSTAAVTFLRGAGLLALNRRVNPHLTYPMPIDERLLPDFV